MIFLILTLALSLNFLTALTKGAIFMKFGLAPTTVNIFIIVCLFVFIENLNRIHKSLLDFIKNNQSDQQQNNHEAKAVQQIYPGKITLAKESKPEAFNN